MDNFNQMINIGKFGNNNNIDLNGIPSANNVPAQNSNQDRSQSQEH